MRMNPALLLPLFLPCPFACNPDTPDSTPQEPVWSDGNVETYRYYAGLMPSMNWIVTVKGEEQFVYPTDEHDICIFACDDTVTVTVTSTSENISSVKVRPLAKNAEHRIKDGSLLLRMAPGDRYGVEINGNDGYGSIILFANPIDTLKPSGTEPDVILYEAGKVYSNPVVVPSGKTLYIEGGAVVEGYISSSNTRDVTIAGGGILRHRTTDEKALGLVGVHNATIRDITVVSASNWTTIASKCDSLRFVNYHAYATASQITETGVENDGLDLLACTNVSHKGCFSYSHDDTYCIKTQKWSTGGPSYNISYEDCIAWNDGGGNGFEIGYELNQDVSHVTYKDIYQIHMTKPRNGNPFRRGGVSIHCAAGGTVSDVSYENVWLEDPKVYGIHMNILKTSYQIGDGVVWAPGVIRDVRMKNVHMGYMPVYGNVVLGYDSTHTIGLTIDGLFIGDNRVYTTSEANISGSYSTVTIQ